ncbi:mucin-5AC-like [Dreissena polymorpha]|uniref:Uncharacterized protein n=1 Tax=Dreissena polymorpha TaxID=45954 RepID=A0A9D4JPN1_DREPO|nr:mucin-5AC-like [Dreissena polymorpha]XP_052286579.1 mucin-5AC-like [Dreissena polymorpha]XP_052286580.1 mucin-5AC-like [Dreissena polymorpha]KAH3818149.1 hypothetical protein DPMN_119745 [Dreissena polymorpha]
MFKTRQTPPSWKLPHLNWRHHQLSRHSSLLARTLAQRLRKQSQQHTISTTEGSTTFSSSNQMPGVSLSVTSSDSLKMVSLNTTSAAFNTSDVPMPMTTFSSNAMSGSPSTSAFTKISTETTATSNATTTTTPNVITETSPKPNTITTITRVTHLTNSSGNSDKEGMTPIPCEESSLGRLGLPVIFAMATVIAILLLIVVILITKQLRTSRRRRRMNDDRDMPRLKMIEIKDADTVRANQVHEDMHTYSLDYDRHVQEKIQEHRRSVQHPAASKPAVGGTTTFQLNKRPSLKPTVDVSSSTTVQPPKSAVPVPPLSATSTFQLAKRLSARGSSTSSTSGQPPPPPSPLLLPGETRHARDTDKANTDDDVFVFNLAKRPSESLTNRRESTRPETEPKKGNSAVTNQEGYGIDKYITDV